MREAELFKTIRTDTSNRGAVFDLIRLMEDDLEIYTALPRPEDSFWSKDDSRHIRALRHFNVRQPWPLLMAARRRFDASGFSDILRACVVVTFRGNVIAGLASNEQERVYNSAVQRIVSGEYAGPADVIRALAPVYVTDDQFKAAFAEKSLRTTAPRNHRVARYILIEIERHLTGIVHDGDNPQLTLEHILPERPGDGWQDFRQDPFGDAAYRLGNLTLLEASINRAIGNADFAIKARAFAGSAYDLTRRVALDNAEWSMDRLTQRQQWLAQQATAIWRIAQLA